MSSGGYKWGERSIIKKCKCGENFKCFKSANRKYCSLICSGKFKPSVKYWEGKKQPLKMRQKQSQTRKKLWKDGKMDHRKKLLGNKNPATRPEVIAKIRKTHEENGFWTPIHKLSDWHRYKRKVNLLTDRKKIFNNWDGICSYCEKEISNEKKWSKYEPTVDHKISIFYGFHNNIKSETIAKLSNLCISCRSCNSSKRENARF